MCEISRLGSVEPQFNLKFNLNSFYSHTRDPNVACLALPAENCIQKFMDQDMKK